MKLENDMLRKVYDSNPELTDRCLYKWCHVGDGLELKIEPNPFMTRGDKSIEPFLGVTFFARLEGKEIGSLDHELGGYIQYPGEDDKWFVLQDKVTEHILKLWGDFR